MRRNIDGTRAATMVSFAALSLAWGPAAAQGVDADTRQLFVPEVAACLEAGASGPCDALKDTMRRCADNPAATVCAMLLSDPEATQADPAALEQVKGALTAFTRDTAQAAEPQAADSAPVVPAPEAPAAEAEPVAPAAPEPAPPPPAEPEPSAPEVPPAEPEPVTEPPAEIPDPAITPPPAEVPEVTEPQPTPAPPEVPDPPAVTEEPVPVDPPVQDPAPAPEAVAPAPEAPAPAEPAPGPVVTDPAPTNQLPPPRNPESEAAEVERLFKEAESQAAAEPEVIEEAITQTDTAPAEAPAPALDAEAKAVVDALSQEPEVAAAIGVLGAALSADPAQAPAGARPETPAEVVEEAATPAIRRSTEEFGSRLVTTAPAAQGERRRNRDLERAGLAALGALAVGMLVNENRVVAQGDDRVVVQRDDGNLQVWRDDDAILRSDGGDRRIERYTDGTTVSQWQREGGERVVTVRDATGRVVSRQRVLADGTTVELFNDAAPVQPVDTATLPDMRYRELRLGRGTDPDRALALLTEAEADARAVDRRFSLRQIRDIRQVRELVPVLSPDPIIFQTNRASIDTPEVAKLYQVGRVIEQLLDRDPREIFLIEGHTDATGSAAYNLGLSDRRAESVALALTEYFRIPPENLIIQGYGESFLRVPTLVAEDRNRRVVIRRITPLLPQ